MSFQSSHQRENGKTNKASGISKGATAQKRTHDPIKPAEIKQHQGLAAKLKRLFARGEPQPVVQEEDRYDAPVADPYKDILG